MTRKLLLLLPLLLFVSQSFAQRFTQYFTNTLYESFENPAQKAFIADSSRMFAFNFLVPNFTVNAYLTGNSQLPIKQSIFSGGITNTNLTFGQNKYNHVYANTNIYLGMFRMYASLNGDQEVGISAQVRGEGKGFFTDETVALFDGGKAFSTGSYSNLFNDKLQYQSYNQISLTYRETLNQQFSVGFKLSGLSGIIRNQFTINSSTVQFDKANDLLILSMAGTRKTNVNPSIFGPRNFVPDFKNPGLSISIGISQQTDNGFKFQYNIKDVGFIHWSSLSNIYNFRGRVKVEDLNKSDAGKRIFEAANQIFLTGRHLGAFNSTTDGRFEVSATKSFWIDWDKRFKYMPVLVASKQVFDTGFTGTLVNNFQYHNLTLGVSGSVNDMRQVYLGGQVMIKSPNAEFFIGCEQLYPGNNFAASALGSEAAINRDTPYTALGLFMGFSLKFGYDIESHQNASRIPMGEDGGLIRRLWNGIFK
ncbi:DUF5723 family protein [Mucilaginibacter sp. KACC 22063]|uniref:DUF5723 family protein n=1 Tax=Mucilaginibacter sp. KACC 22063 TaxID=3025666 RepID=UPI0023668229|nr:DUF5723 family protein [Mucilaginibacter sp. KACC 22063]WDF54154.1 DUF5723 family protein [Mucilaginibacter sp. KACC 22063]